MEGLSALLTGDIEEDGVRALLGSGADLRADLLLLPHHGSARVPSAGLLAAACRARTAVASAGPGTLRLGSVASPFAPVYLSTSEGGAVVVTPSGARFASGR
jgi:hypothetical protein